MAFTLADDGELDTVLRCDDCGQEMHHNFDGSIELSPEAIEAEYWAWVTELLREANKDHGCGTAMSSVRLDGEPKVSR